MIVLFAPHGLVLGVAAVAPALLSSQPTRKRLGLVRGRAPLWTWPILIISAPFAGLIMELLCPFLVEEPGESIRLLVSVVRGRSPVGLLAASMVIVVQAGLLEELLFRGYVQTRLLKRWHPVWAIALPTLIFTLLHMDWRHMLGVWPVGVWLGVIAWRAGSVWPCILGHCLNNALFMVIVRLSNESDLYRTDWDGSAYVQVGVFGGAFLLSLLILWKAVAPPGASGTPAS